jgi:hypothetical protein
MKRTNETVGQAWRRELSIVDIEDAGFAAYEAACKCILLLQPMLAMDSKALYFAAQGWLAAKNEATDDA